MANKNYVKALRRAKSKKLFNINLIAFTALGATLFFLNLTIIATNTPWSLIPIGFMLVILAFHKLTLFKRPQKTIFSKDYLEYQTEKELRLIEFEDDMDEIEAEKLEHSSLQLPELSRRLRGNEGELV